MTDAAAERAALIIGASRGLGLALAAEYVTRGRRVTATVRGRARTELHDLAESSDGRLHRRVDGRRGPPMNRPRG